MTDYMLLVHEDEAGQASETPQAMAELIGARAAFAEGLRRTGRLKDGGRLRPSKEGRRIRRVQGRPQVEAGPFAGERAALGAFYCVEAESAEDAARIALACPVRGADEIDVRPVMRGRYQPDREAKPGKIFGCGVLGNAPNEEAWVEVMNRIEAESDPLPEGAFVGGVRLQPPKSGKHVVSRGAARAIFDGPFLESKEVIGGLFFLRLNTLEDVLAWAGGMRSLVHGALEIRELWRS